MSSELVVVVLEVLELDVLLGAPMLVGVAALASGPAGGVAVALAAAGAGRRLAWPPRTRPALLSPLGRACELPASLRDSALCEPPCF